MTMRSVRTALLLAVLTALVASPEVAPAGPVRLSTPELIERAVEAGSIDRDTADLYVAYALFEPERLPNEYRSDVPWDGTLPLLHLRENARTMDRGAERREIRELIGSSDSGPLDTCSTATGTNQTDTVHFHIHYTSVGGGLTLDDYKTSLEATWNAEVNTFGWAAPPINRPDGRYLVVLAPLGNGLYGFVMEQTDVGNNPNTSWNEGDAHTSCMVLNDNYSGFRSPAQESLDATVGHEFSHSIQYGYGALAGPNVPDGSFIEGLATWIEDDVFDASNDNYYYLWPNFADDMADYGTTTYPYWIVFRAIAERFGTTLPAGSEQLYQRFWEAISQNQGGQLDALNAALAPAGLDLATAYHDAAVALAFNRGCGGGYGYPFCLEEGPGYVALRGPPPQHGSLPGIGPKGAGSLPDSYSLNWITLPLGTGPFQAVLKNTSNGGLLRASVACDTGGQIINVGLSGNAGGGETVTLPSFDPTGCQSLVGVVTNVTQSSGNPSSSPARSYEFFLTPPPDSSSISLKVKKDDEDVIAKGKVKPSHNGDRLDVTLFRKKGKGFKKVKSEHPQLKQGSRYEADFNRPDARRCQIVASFPGDLDHLGSDKTKTFRC